MDKKEILEIVSEKIKTGEISSDEILNLIDNKNSLFGESLTHKISNILYTIGGLIIFCGLLFFFSQYWSSMGAFAKVFSTLGFGLISYVVAMVIKTREQIILPSVLLIFSAIFIPFGIGIFLNEMQVDVSKTLQANIYLGLFIIFSVTYFVSKRNLATLIAMCFGFLTYISFIELILLNSNVLYVDKLFKIAIIIISLSYGYIAYFISSKDSIDHIDKKTKTNLSEFIYFFSVIGLIAPLFGNGVFVDFLAILILIGIFYLSAFVKSSRMLFAASAMFMIYFSSILIEYFSDSFGVSLIIILIGMLIVATGFVTFRINSKMIK